MGSIMLLYGPKSDQAALSGGSWETTLPLANLQDRRFHKVARSTDANASSTKFFVDLGGVESFRGIVAGPTNLTNTYGYRVRSYTDNDFDTIVYDSEWVEPSPPIPYGTLPFGAPYWWDGLVPWDDPDRTGPWIIHIFDKPTAARCWSLEINAESNPDGYVDIGRLFMAGYLTPSFSYGQEANGLNFIDNTLRASTLSGGSVDWRRVNPRTFQFGFPYLPTDEVFTDVYPFMLQAGFDGEVFVIPDDADTEHMQKRSFLGKISQMEPLRGYAFGYTGSGFEIREII